MFNRWRFVVHGGIDGFSRLIVFLRSNGNDRSTTVLSLFHDAMQQYGQPDKIRIDRGGEYIYSVAAKI